MKHFVQGEYGTKIIHAKINQSENLNDSVPTHIMEDFRLDTYEFDTGCIFIKPGIVITQRDNIVCGKRPSGTEVFSFTVTSFLEQFIYNVDRLYALDRLGNVHVCYTSGKAAEIYNIPIHPLAWCSVPNSSAFIMWDVSQLRMFDLNSTTMNNDIIMTAHLTQVTNVVSDTNKIVSGDSSGHMCVWDTEKWTCKHNVCTGTNSILQLDLSDSGQTCVRTSASIIVYDGDQCLYSLDIKDAVCVRYTAYGLLVAHQETLEMFVGGAPRLQFAHGARRLIRNVHNRVWAVSGRKILSLDIGQKQDRWPYDLLKWMENPTFPLQNNWPKRTLDVLAMNTDMWIPNTDSWKPPRTWFRHPKLREAIFETVVKHDIRLAEEWMYLPYSTLVEWYEICLHQLATLTATPEYTEEAMRLLEHIYKSITIRDLGIRKWCWLHHGKMRMRPVVLHLTDVDNTGEFIAHILAEPASPDAVMCMSETAIQYWMRTNNYVAVFVQWLLAYHVAYPFGPTQQTRAVFQMVASHLFAEATVDSIDVPLSETGRWELVQRLSPNDIGRFAKVNNQRGFITEVHCQPGGVRVVRWRPLARTRDVHISSSADIHLWVFRTTGPHTHFECAMVLLNQDLWHSAPNTAGFRWFKSELGAFLVIGQHIRVFDRPVQVTGACWDSGASITTSSGLHIREDECVPVQCNITEWSYLEENLFHLAPLRLKICNIVSLSVRTNLVRVRYARELLQCCDAYSFNMENTWYLQHKVTSVISEIGMFVIGFQNGTICEYQHVSGLKTPSRTFKSHTCPVTTLYVTGSRMASMCTQKMCVWCTATGMYIFETVSMSGFVAMVPQAGNCLWLVDQCGDGCRAVLWDIFEQIPLHSITLDIDSSAGHFIATSLDTVAVISNGQQAVVWDMEGSDQIAVFDGTVTTLCKVDDYVCGGTSEGCIFKLNCKTLQLYQWGANMACAQKGAIVAMCQMDNFIILGSDKGEMFLANVTTMETEDVHVQLNDSPVEHIYVDSMFVTVVQGRYIHLLTFVDRRCMVACHTLRAILHWSPVWKNIVMNSTVDRVQPVVTECISNRDCVHSALDVIEMCTEDYSRRKQWCSSEMVDLLLTVDNANLVLRRLVTFVGHKIDCVICGDDESADTVSYISKCHHRFHTGCIGEHIRMLPEVNREMQYEYALTVELKCPTCRTVFESEDVKLDSVLNK